MRKKKTAKESEATLSYLMTPGYVNLGGSVHGGEIMKLIDHAAFVSASRYCEGYCVTAEMDKVEVKSPVKIGQLVDLNAKVIFTVRTSMRIKVNVCARDIRTGKVTHTNSCLATMVAVNDRGKPVKVPKLIPETDEEKNDFVKAKRAYEAEKLRES